MSDGYRNGAFALGLVTGGGLVINLLLWSAYRANKTRETVRQGQEDPESHPWVSFWDWLITTFINPYDTIAQWCMTILSLAAVYLLWETLKAGRRTLRVTQETAKDTRRIGEDQTRAYINYIEYSATSIRDKNTNVALDIIFVPKVKNTGQSPGTITFMGSHFQFYPNAMTCVGVKIKRDEDSHIVLPPGETLDFVVPKFSIREIASNLERGLRLFCFGYLEYRHIYSDPDGPAEREGFCLEIQFRLGALQASANGEDVPMTGETYSIRHSDYAIEVED